MRYFVKVFLGVGLFAASLTAFSYALHEVLQIGTCASGGPYVSARECPEGTATWIITLTLSVFTGLIGAGIFAVRGRPPGDEDSSAVGRGVGTGLLLWSVFFTVTGAVALWTVIDPEADLGPGSTTGGLIVGPLFLLMGLVPAVLGVLGWLGSRGRTPMTSALSSSTLLGDSDDKNRFTPSTVVHGSAPRPAPAPTSGPTPSFGAARAATDGGDPLDQLRRLDELRDNGVISDAEFIAAKAKLLEKM